MPNRLAAATSPYLRQHADNPVDWYEWGQEAFTEAITRDVPVLLSVGYSACHWCHVMAHESFEDAVSAAYMNAHFVNVKVDREERPDVDRIYMDAVTAMTGRGGWPMTVFLTPDQRPIHAGTYYPKQRMANHPSFMDIMTAVVGAWETNRTGVRQQADAITKAITDANPPAGSLPREADIIDAVSAIERTFDAVNGGFGRAPKFPQAPTLEFLLRVAALHRGTEAAATAERMLTTTLASMATGGIYDHITGGFARYSVDAVWLVPHFEKMLYDNALLARLYLRTWQLTGDDRFKTTAIEVLDYLHGTMVDHAGALHAAEDADSEGVEGRFCVWPWDELAEVLGDDLPVAAAIYGFTQEGNFDGANIPTRRSNLSDIATAHDLTLADLHELRASIDQRLRDRRATRVPPGRDDKIVSAWNGFALRAFAEGWAILGTDSYLERAEAIAGFLVTTASPDGQLVRSWRDQAGVGAFADDLAAVAIGLYTLYQASGDARWFGHAEQLVATLRSDHADPAGGFFAPSINAERLITRPKITQDNPTPSDNALGMEALLIHASLTGDHSALTEMESTMRSLSVIATRHPSFAGHALGVWATHLVGVKEVAVTGPPGETEAMERLIWDSYRPDVVLAVNRGTGSPVPLLIGRDATDSATAFVCENLTCSLPVHSPEALAGQLDS